MGAFIGYNFVINFMHSFRRFLSVLAIVGVSIGTAKAQPAPAEFRAGVEAKPDYATLHLSTRLGSFKLLNGQGKVQIKFKGTLLLNVSKDSKVTPSGKLKKHYDKHNRQVFFGEGQIVVTGKWGGIQWFGRDMEAMWYGTGLARLTGEFDKDLKTGFYWYDDPNDKEYWYAGGGSMEVRLPDPRKNQVVPRERKE